MKERKATDPDGNTWADHCAEEIRFTVRNLPLISRVSETGQTGFY